MRVRPSTPADAPAMLDVARALPQWFNAGGREEMVRDFQTHQGFVAEDERGAGEGAVLGFVTYRPLSPEAALLSWIGVRPELRGQGLGRKLLAALEEALVAQGFAHLEVETLAETADHPPYDQTRRFYLAVGFRPRRLVYERWGPGQDALVLGKETGYRSGGGEDVRFVVRVVRVGEAPEAGDGITGSSASACPTDKLCRAAHKVGQTFEFDWRTPEGLCGEAYAAIYPLLFAMRVGGDMRQLGSPERDVRRFTCPSRMVRFEVHAVRVKA